MAGRGRFKLYDYINPALDAGRYTLTADVQLGANVVRDSDQNEIPPDPFSTPVSSHAVHFNISAPRIKLPPDHVLMTYPPANSEGAYDSRLPQIVLRKRSLPWERAADAEGEVHHGHRVGPGTPWLALVVIAEGEGEVIHDAPVAECFTQGLTLEGTFESPTGSYLNVPESTVEKVFPTVADLELLSHVREVNPDDTEHAMGDDDGFLAVIIGNRTPLYDEQNCRPRSYMACLINLEGQLDVLPKPTPPQSGFNLADFITNDVMLDHFATRDTDAAVPVRVTASPRTLNVGDEAGLTNAVRRGEVVLHNGLLVDRLGVAGDGALSVLGAIDETAFLNGDFAAIEPVAEIVGDQVLRVEGRFSNFDFPLEAFLKQKFFRFPVLTSWRFTCSGAGSFGQLMGGLDVGLMGTKTDGAFARQFPDCTDPPSPDAKKSKGQPASKLPLEVAETGHIGMPHLTRSGNRGTAWYRGPFSPFQLHRDPVDKDRAFPKLAHVSDHLRMMTPDGREDVSLAVAFETGRLLAMSQPSFLAALHRWRLAGFTKKRKQDGQRNVLRGQDDLLDRLRGFDFDKERIEDAIRAAQIIRMMESGLLGGLAARPDVGISTPRDLVDPGVPINALKNGGMDILAQGLGIPVSILNEVARDPTSLDALDQLSRVETGSADRGDIELGPEIDGKIDAALDIGLREIAELTVGGAQIDEAAVEGITVFETLRDFETDLLKRGR